MKSLFLSLSLFAVTAISAQSSKPAVTSETAITQSFNKFRTAVIQANGNEAIRYVDNHTIEYYGRILELVRNADSSKVSKLPIIDKLNVLIARHMGSKEEFRNLDGAGFLAYAISRGMLDKKTYESQSLGEVQLHGDSAQAQMVMNKKPLPVYYTYYKQAGTWKLDITSLFSLAALGLRTIIMQSGMTENEYIFSLLESMSGRTADNSVWKPMR